MTTTKVNMDPDFDDVGDEDPQLPFELLSLKKLLVYDACPIKGN